MSTRLLSCFTIVATVAALKVNHLRRGTIWTWKNRFVERDKENHQRNAHRGRQKRDSEKSMIEIRICYIKNITTGPSYRDDKDLRLDVCRSLLDQEMCDRSMPINHGHYPLVRPSERLVIRVNGNQREFVKHK
uniref:Secreted protein n=1 Tax=Heterorhabditis bacteriophora TaxID=37862 RepID=A0A1I7WX12_HETBA